METKFLLYSSPKHQDNKLIALQNSRTLLLMSSSLLLIRCPDRQHKTSATSTRISERDLTLNLYSYNVCFLFSYHRMSLLISFHPDISSFYLYVHKVVNYTLDIKWRSFYREWLTVITRLRCRLYVWSYLVW